MALKNLTQTEAAERLRISTSWLRTLTDRELITRNDDGSYPWPTVADEFDAYKAESSGPGGESAPDYDAARTRKAIVEAMIREDELAVRRGELVPASEVLARIREPLERVDAKLRTAVRTHSKSWAMKLGVSQAQAMALMHDVIEDVRADLRELFEDPDDSRDAA